MQIDAEQLDEILGEELRVFDELAQACSEATKRIVKGEIDGLAGVTRRQNELIMAAAEVGKVRSALQRELSADESDQSRQAAPAPRFISEPYASRFAEHDEKLRSTVDALREQSEYNRVLLVYSLEMVDRAMRSVCNTSKTPVTYESPGTSSDCSPSDSSLFDRKT